MSAVGEDRYKCPNCEQVYYTYYKIAHARFGNMGMEYYSDGRNFELRGENDSIPVVYCEKCKNYFWLKDAPLVPRKRKENRDEDEELYFHPAFCSFDEYEYNDGEYGEELKPLELHEYIDFIEKKLFRNSKEEYTVREQAWFIINDKDRSGEIFNMCDYQGYFKYKENEPEIDEQELNKFRIQNAARFLELLEMIKIEDHFNASISSLMQDPNVLDFEYSFRKSELFRHLGKFEDSINEIQKYKEGVHSFFADFQISECEKEIQV